MMTRIVERIEQLKDAVPARTVVMRLDPPELGAIELTVRARGHRVEAAVSTQNEWVRHVLDANRPHLAEQLNNRGLNLEAFDVSSQAHGRHGQGREPSQGPGSPVADMRGVPTGPEDGPVLGSISLYSRMVDLEA